MKSRGDDGATEFLGVITAAALGFAAIGVRVLGPDCLSYQQTGLLARVRHGVRHVGAMGVHGFALWCCLSMLIPF